MATESQVGSVQYFGEHLPDPVATSPLEVECVTATEELVAGTVCLYDLESGDLDTVDAICERETDCPLLVLAGSKTDVGEALARGATDYVRKAELKGEAGDRILANRVRGYAEQTHLETRTELYRGMVETAPDPIYALDSEGRFEEANEAAMEISGYDESELLGRKATDLVTESGQEKSLEAIRNLRQGKTEKELVEFNLVRKDGESIPVEGHFALRQPDSEDYRGVVGMLRDISERKERERELETYEKMLNAVPDPIFAVDAGGQYVEVNEAAVSLMDYDYEELIGLHVSEVMGREELEKSRNTVRELLSTDTDRTKAMTEHEVVTKDGEQFAVEVHMRLRRPENGDFHGVAGAIRDISERKERERELQRQTHDMELLNRILRHDVRNDMQYILTVGELLTEQIEDERATEKLSTLVDKAANVVELTTTVRDLVDTITAEGSETLGEQPLDDVLWAELEDVQQSKDAVFHVDEIPSVSVRADEMLSSLFRNLLENGIEHNDKELPEIEVDATVTDEAVSVRIADNGPGIPEEIRDDIFDPGEKGFGSTGTGIGLYLVDRLVTRYGGDVDIGDNDPEGAVFTVTLPRAD